MFTLNAPGRTPLLAAAATVLVVTACGSSSTGTDPGSTPTAAASHGTTGMAGTTGMTGMAGGEHHSDPGKGLRISEDGYSLKPTTRVLTTGTQTIRFVIQGPDGRSQTSYTLDQTKRLHFYLVRNDLTGYVHDHPTLGPDGTWSINVDIAKPGPYRMYADFIARDTGGKDHPVVLSTPLNAPGQYTPAPILMAGQPQNSTGSAQTQTAQGLTVSMNGKILAGTASKVTFSVTAGGRPVTDLEQYLDSFAHMTAVHSGDLAYQHVHPELNARPGQKGGPALPFTVELPEKGTWRLFLQVQRGGTLHLIPFTISAG